MDVGKDRSNYYKTKFACLFPYIYNVCSLIYLKLLFDFQKFSINLTHTLLGLSVKSFILSPTNNNNGTAITAYVLRK